MGRGEGAESGADPDRLILTDMSYPPLYPYPHPIPLYLSSSGLWISTEEANETEDDILVMLSKGVAYACSSGSELLVKRLYQQVWSHCVGVEQSVAWMRSVDSLFFTSLNCVPCCFFAPPWQALLYIPEAAVKLPPIHVLVVDYSSIYGTDCAAVDTIVMQVWGPSGGGGQYLEG